MDVQLLIILFYYAFNVHGIKEMTRHFNLFNLCFDLEGGGRPGYRFINSILKNHLWFHGFFSPGDFLYTISLIFILIFICSFLWLNLNFNFSPLLISIFLLGKTAPESNCSPFQMQTSVNLWLHVT